MRDIIIPRVAILNSYPRLRRCKRCSGIFTTKSKFGKVCPSCIKPTYKKTKKLMENIK